MPPPAASRRLPRLTPGAFLTALLVVECLLLYFQPIRRLAAYDHRAWPAISTLAFTAGGLALLGLWAITARLFRGRFQFGLRTLVLLVVCIAVPCAALATELQRVRRTRQAEITIRALGGKLDVLPYFGLLPFARPKLQPARPPAWFATILGEDVFYEPAIESLEFKGHNFTDDTCRLWREFPRVDSLRLEHTRVTGEGLRLLPDFRGLSFLMIEGSSLSDHELAPVFGCRGLWQLHLNRTRVTDGGLSRLGELEQLTDLSLRGSPIQGAGFDRVSRLPKLQALDLSDTRLDDAGLKAVSRFQSLQLLELSGTAITDAALDHLAQMPKLTDLYLSRTAISDAGLTRLARFHKLERLEISGTASSREGRRQLRQALPGCQVAGPASDAEGEP